VAAHSLMSRRWPWLVGAVVAIVVSLVVADPYLPATISYSTGDSEALQEYQRIVAAHGFKYHVDVAPNGERSVVIDSISQRHHSCIECDLERWRVATHRDTGVTNASSTTCAP
jgi:hypothetical protein